MAKIDIATAKQEIIDWLYEGGSILGYCQQEGRPKRRTIYDWVDADPEFGAQFARAREAGAGTLIDLAQSVADDGSNDTYTDDEGNQRTDHDVVARSKLRVDTLFKRAACYCPRLYGTKVAVGGDASAPAIKVEQTPGPAAPQSAAELRTWAAKLAAMTGDAPTSSD